MRYAGYLNWIVVIIMAEIRAGVTFSSFEEAKTAVEEFCRPLPRRQAQELRVCELELLNKRLPFICLYVSDSMSSTFYFI